MGLCGPPSGVGLASRDDISYEPEFPFKKRHSFNQPVDEVIIAARLRYITVKYVISQHVHHNWSWVFSMPNILLFLFD